MTTDPLEQIARVFGLHDRHKIIDLRFKDP